MLETTNSVSLADLRAMDEFRFQELVLKSFKRLGYSMWLSGKSGCSILLKSEEPHLIKCNQEKKLVDVSLIRDFCQALKKEGLESGFFVTTGAITLLDREYLLDESVDFIDAKRLVPFFETIFGEAGFKREISQIFERRKFPRFDLRNFGEDKILRRVDTLYGTSLQPKGEIADISCKGIGFESNDKIPPSSLLRLELFLPDATDNIKVIGKIAWQEAKADFSAYKLGMSFLLVGDKDKEEIANFVKSRLCPEQNRVTQDNFEPDQDFLLRSLVEKNIISRAVSDFYTQDKNSGLKGDNEVDIKMAEASTKRFFKKTFLKKCKILEVHKIATGWEVLAKKIDDWFEKRGYRDVYEKSIYVVKLNDKFKVVSYFQAGKGYVSKGSDLQASYSSDTNKIREIVREVVKEVSAGNGNNNVEKLTEDILKKIAVETANEIEGRSKDSQKKVDEKIEIKESYISPLQDLRLERNFKRIGKTKRSKKDIKNNVESFQGVKNGKR